MSRLLRAIRGASARGVDVKLIVPENVDSLLTRYASRSLLRRPAGSWRRDLSVSGGAASHESRSRPMESACMFGTVNLDMRSLWLNYEVAYVHLQR
jgi:cardiolipin synthase